MSTVADTFLDFLVITLSKTETNGHDVDDILKYNGPADSRTESVTRSLETILRKRRVAESDLAQASPFSTPKSEDDAFELDDGWVMVSKPETMLPPSNASLVLPVSQATQSQHVSASAPLPENIRRDAIPCFDAFTLPMIPPLTQTPDPIQELRLLKAQVSDFVRVCNAVSRGDFTQKLYGWADSIVMEQFRDVVNGMVGRLIP